MFESRHQVGRLRVLEVLVGWWRVWTLCLGWFVVWLLPEFPVWRVFVVLGCLLAQLDWQVQFGLGRLAFGWVVWWA